MRCSRDRKSPELPWSPSSPPPKPRRCGIFPGPPPPSLGLRSTSTRSLMIGITLLRWCCRQSSWLERLASQNLSPLREYCTHTAHDLPVAADRQILLPVLGSSKSTPTCCIPRDWPLPPFPCACSRTNSPEK